jgi:hypothetical protein
VLQANENWVPARSVGTKETRSRLTLPHTNSCRCKRVPHICCCKECSLSANPSFKGLEDTVGALYQWASSLSGVAFPQGSERHSAAEQAKANEETTPRLTFCFLISTLWDRNRLP